MSRNRGTWGMPSEGTAALLPVGTKLELPARMVWIFTQCCVQYFNLSQGRSSPSSLVYFWFIKYILKNGDCYVEFVSVPFLWRFTASARKARELCISKKVVSAGSLDPWNLVLGQTLSKPACLVWWQASCVSCVCCSCLGLSQVLQMLLFSVGTAEQRLFSHHLPTGGDRIIKGQMLFCPVLLLLVV